MAGWEKVRWRVVSWQIARQWHLCERGRSNNVWHMGGWPTNQMARKLMILLRKIVVFGILDVFKRYFSKYMLLWGVLGKIINKEKSMKAFCLALVLVGVLAIDI